MSLVGELSYFLGLQIKQLNDEIFISQAKYAKNLVKKFGLEMAKYCDTPMSTTDDSLFVSLPNCELSKECS